MQVGALFDGARRAGAGRGRPDVRVGLQRFKCPYSYTYRTVRVFRNNSAATDTARIVCVSSHALIFTTW